MISRIEVENIAKLARLELTDKEIEKMAKDMSAVLDYFEVLKQAPRNHAKTHPAKEKGSRGAGAESRGTVKNVTREDVAKERNSRLVNDLLAQVPQRKEEYIKVKAIL
ncbi:MAG: Asp-tRNA(Asn)/Glu-tRNA(Gln) amidotransferase subunit GatC [Patescibacteria group bacterium]